MGIGGIGMSGLASIMRAQGHCVSGCDQNCSQKSIALLRAQGCSISEGHNGSSCKDETIETLIYSTAVSLSHPEILRAKKRGITLWHRSELLANLSKEHTTIAIAGSHGKTTTTALIGHLLVESKLDPTIVVGGFVQNLGSNARVGASEYLVAEADESDRSFVRLSPSIAVITNIDLEHLDTYHDINDIKSEFCHFIAQLSEKGKAIVCIDDQNVSNLIQQMLPARDQNKIITYGRSSKAHYQISNIELFSSHSTGTISFQNGTQHSFLIPLAGSHNALNATAAIAVAHELGVSPTVISSAIEKFRGVEQRFTWCGTFHRADVFDDYGHHPTEIFHTLQIARKRAEKRVIVIFQPQRFSRTEKLWGEFIHVLSRSPIDQLIITDIYPAGEQPIQTISGARLATELAHHAPFPVIYCPEEPGWATLQKLIENLTQTGDLLLFMGAGKVNSLAHKIARK